MVNDETTVFGVEQAKGLEFDYVAVVNFFQCIEQLDSSKRKHALIKSWKEVAKFELEDESRDQRRSRAGAKQVDDELEVLAFANFF